MDLALLTDDTTVRAAWQGHEVSRCIEAGRKRLLQDERLLNALPGGHGPFDEQTVGNAVRGSKNLINCLRLCNAAAAFGHHGVVELGTNLGVSTAYLALGAAFASSESMVVTGDASGARIEIAKALHRECGLGNVRYVVGMFEETLDELYTAIPRFQLAFIDGDHTYVGTHRYHQAACRVMPRGSLLIFDDIDWSDEMRAAWADISGSTTADRTHAVDGVGYLVV